MSRVGKITLWTLCETNTAITYNLEEVHSSTGSSSSSLHFGSEVVVHVRCLRYLYLDGYEN